MKFTTAQDEDVAAKPHYKGNPHVLISVLDDYSCRVPIGNCETFADMHRVIDAMEAAAKRHYEKNSTT